MSKQRRTYNKSTTWELFKIISYARKAQIEELMKQGANLNAVESDANGQEWTVLQKAVFWRNKEAVSTLLANGADPNKSRLKENSTLGTAMALTAGSKVSVTSALGMALMELIYAPSFFTDDIRKIVTDLCQYGAKITLKETAALPMKYSWCQESVLAMHKYKALSKHSNHRLQKSIKTQKFKRTVTRAAAHSMPAVRYAAYSREQNVYSS